MAWVDDCDVHGKWLMILAGRLPLQGGKPSPAHPTGRSGITPIISRHLYMAQEPLGYILRGTTGNPSPTIRRPLICSILPPWCCYRVGGWVWCAAWTAVSCASNPRGHTRTSRGSHCRGAWPCSTSGWPTHSRSGDTHIYPYVSSQSTPVGYACTDRIFPLWCWLR